MGYVDRKTAKKVFVVNVLREGVKNLDSWAWMVLALFACYDLEASLPFCEQ